MMQLYEQGKFLLNDPVHKYIPGWRNLRVYKGGRYPDFETEPAASVMTIRDLMNRDTLFRVYSMTNPSPVLP